MPPALVAEIDAARDDDTSRSEWLCDAARARLDREESGTWESTDDQ